MPDPLDTSGKTLHAFLDQVCQDSPQVGSVGEAERLSRGVLATLAETVSHGQLTDLAAGLPPELRSELDQGKPQAASIDRSSFLDRVSGQISAGDIDVVEQQTRAVLATMASWAPPGETDDTLNQLPPALRDLFTSPA